MLTRTMDLLQHESVTIDCTAVDTVLLSHPHVQDAAAFGMAGENGCEHLACALVLTPDATLNRAEMRVFAARLLASPHVPLDICFVTAIPRSPTGRPRRKTLAQQVLSFRATGDSPAQPCSDERDLGDIETALLARWRSTLNCPSLHPDEDFFSAGGNESSATAMLLEVKAAFSLRYKLLYDGFAYEPTIFHLAKMIRCGQEMRAPQPSAQSMRVVPVRESDSSTHPTLYLMPPDGDEGTCFRMLSDALGPEWPVSVVRPAGLLHRTGPYRIEEAARECAELIREDSAGRPFALGGFCYGGVLAAETARLLEGKCRALVLFDTPLPNPVGLHHPRDTQRWWRSMTQRPHKRGWVKEFGKFIVRRTVWHGICSLKPLLVPAWETPLFGAVARRVCAADMKFFFRLKPLQLPVLHLLSAGHTSPIWREAVLDWHQVAPGRVTISRLSGQHLRLFFGANLLQMKRDLHDWFAGIHASEAASVRCAAEHSSETREWRDTVYSR